MAPSVLDWKWNYKSECDQWETHITKKNKDKTTTQSMLNKFEFSSMQHWGKIEARFLTKICLIN